MSVSHHGNDKNNDGLMRRFVEEATGLSRREFPNGRVGPDDDGSMTYAVAADPKHGIVRIVFSKPTTWLGLNVESIDQLIACLEEKKLVIRGLAPKEPS